MNFSNDCQSIDTQSALIDMTMIQVVGLLADPRITWKAEKARMAEVATTADGGGGDDGGGGER